VENDRFFRLKAFFFGASQGICQSAGRFFLPQRAFIKAGIPLDAAFVRRMNI
jgi:hypothetical protein